MIHAEFNYTSDYARVEIRGTVREALLMPQTFAKWGKAHLALAPAMGAWSARQWVSTFLKDITGISWLVTATELDLADMPRHDPEKRVQLGEWATDDPSLIMPIWLLALTRNDVVGSTVVQFITETLLPFSFDSLPTAKILR